MKRSLLVLLAICVISIIGLTAIIISSQNKSLEISDSHKKEEAVEPPQVTNPTNLEIIAKNLAIDNLEPGEIALFLGLNPDEEAISPEVLGRQISRLTAFSGLLQAADENSVTIAPLFNAPENFTIVSGSSIERNNEEHSWDKLVKGDRIDLISLDGQVVKLVSSGLITTTDISQTISDAISISPDAIDKLLSGDATGIQKDALSSLKNFLLSNYNLPENTIDALLSGKLNLNKDTIEDLILERLVSALKAPEQTISES